MKVHILTILNDVNRNIKKNHLSVGFSVLAFVTYISKEDTMKGRREYHRSR